MSAINLPNGIVCTPEEYALSLSTHNKEIYCLNRTDGIGLTTISEAGLISLVALLWVFAVILRNVIWRVRNEGDNRIFHQPMDLLMFSLFFADVIQAIGGVMGIKWVVDGKVQVGSYCTAQGVVQNVGETTVALTTLTITVYTFLGVWMGGSVSSMRHTKIVLAGIWLFVALVVIIGNTIPRNPNKAQFQSPTPYWCWINGDYMAWRIFAEYLWFWITLVLSCLVYIPLYFWARGNIVPPSEDQPWWRFKFQRADRSEDRRALKQPLVLAAYPVVYCLNVLPLSVVRWIGFVQEAHGPNKIPAAATFAVTTIYTLSGLCNVILLLTTKPDAGLFAKVTYFSSGRPPTPVEASSFSMQEETEDYHGEPASRYGHGHSSVSHNGIEEASLGRLPSR